MKTKFSIKCLECKTIYPPNKKKKCPFCGAINKCDFLINRYIPFEYTNGYNIDKDINEFLEEKKDGWCNILKYSKPDLSKI